MDKTTIALITLMVIALFVAFAWMLNKDQKNVDARSKEYNEFIKGHDCTDANLKIRTQYIKRCTASGWHSTLTCHERWKATYCIPPEMKKE